MHAVPKLMEKSFKTAKPYICGKKRKQSEK